MKSNTIQKVWLFSAFCFLIVGLRNKDILYLIVSYLYICIGYYKLNKKNKTKWDKEK